MTIVVEINKKVEHFIFDSFSCVIMNGVITYVEAGCPHKTRIFDDWDVKKSLRPSHVLSNILGYCFPSVPSRDVQYNLISKVQEYRELWYFLRFLQLVSKCFLENAIPSRMYDDVSSVSRFVNFCESLEDTLYEQVKHFPSPKGAAKQLNLYTHWYEYSALGDVFRKNGIGRNDVIEAYVAFTKLPRGYGRQVYAASIGEMFMYRKFSPDWYRMQQRHGAIM